MSLFQVGIVGFAGIVSLKSLDKYQNEQTNHYNLAIEPTDSLMTEAPVHERRS
jgi:hypothetical protein